MNIIDSPDFLNLPPDVGAIFSAADYSFFNLPEWYDLVARHGMDAGWGTRIYSAGAAALVACISPQDGRTIRGCCNMYSIDYSPLAAGSDAAAGVRGLVARMALDNPSTDAFLLPGLDPGSGLFAAALAGFKDAGFVAKPYFSWGSWFEPVESVDFPSFLAARPSALRNTARRKLAALQKTARVEFRTSGDVERFISDYDDVYQRSWKVPEPFRGFMPALMRMAAQKGALRFGVLTIDARPVAAQFWIVWKARAIIYKLAYDEKAGAFSPGTLLTMRMVRDVLEKDRPTEINFGRGDDDYKRLWLSQRRERWGIEAANPKTARGLPRSLRLSAAKLRDRLLQRARPA